MSSATPRLSRPGSQSYRRWARAGLAAAGHGLGIFALAAAGARLLLALAAPLLRPLLIFGRLGEPGSRGGAAERVGLGRAVGPSPARAPWGHHRAST